MKGEKERGFKKGTVHEFIPASDPGIENQEKTNAARV